MQQQGDEKMLEKILKMLERKVYDLPEIVIEKISELLPISDLPDEQPEQLVLNRDGDHLEVHIRWSDLNHLTNEYDDLTATFKFSWKIVSNPTREDGLDYSVLMTRSVESSYCPIPFEEAFEEESEEVVEEASEDR